MPLRVMAKTTRGCGTRKIGGLYLYFEAAYVHHCKATPPRVARSVSCCGEHIRQIRSVQVSTLIGYSGMPHPKWSAAFCSVVTPRLTAV
jgi:hypothetical protein